jgi:hypothetical protein
MRKLRFNLHGENSTDIIKIIVMKTKYYNF